MSDSSHAHRRLLVLFAVLAGVVLALVPAPAGARVVPMEWHRLDIGNEPPSHERLKCLTDGEWRCMYTSLPGPGLTNGPFRGIFTGTDVTGTQECADWLGDLCDEVVRIIDGQEQFFEPGTQRDPEFPPVHVQLLVLEDGTMWVTWIDSLFGTFSCPWYPTWAEAQTLPAECIALPEP
jgi:hypothetical protein